jgi:hypothetical protein
MQHTIGTEPWMCIQLRNWSTHWLWRLIPAPHCSQCNPQMPAKGHTCQLHILNTNGKASTTCNQRRNQSILLRLHLILCLRYMMCMTSRARFHTYFRMHWNMSRQDKLSIALDLCKWTKRTNHNFVLLSQHRDIHQRFFCSWKMCDID